MNAKYNAELENVQQAARELDALICTPATTKKEFTDYRLRLFEIIERIEADPEPWTSALTVRFSRLLDILRQMGFVASIGIWRIGKTARTVAEHNADALERLSAINRDLRRLSN